MLVEPDDPILASVYPGTRLLTDTLGIIGQSFWDPNNEFREWTVHSLFSPIPGRSLQGVRARLEDNKGFVSFCNQRDLEVLLGYGRIDSTCPWTGRPYPAPNDPEWYGLCMDSEDLKDDLLQREMALRVHDACGALPPGAEITRRLHLMEDDDLEELVVLINDDDFGIAGLTHRWARVERRPGPLDRRTFWERLR